MPARVITFQTQDNSRGPGRSCSLIINEFPRCDLSVNLITPRARVPLRKEIKVEQVLPLALRSLPWKLTAKTSMSRLVDRFSELIRTADPLDTILYIWPGAPLAMLDEARQRGFFLVREMINSPCLAAKDILDRAYTARGLPPKHSISDEVARTEAQELSLYDLVFASNEHVEKFLLDAGIDATAIGSTSFGYDARQIQSQHVFREGPRLKFLFLGTLDLRKGILDLLDAWSAAELDADLYLAGDVDPLVQRSVDAAVGRGNVKLLGFVRDVNGLLSDVDVFVFPTLEEGGPQVTYEAAAAGLPILTTPMGAARLVKDGLTGMIVAPEDPASLAIGLKRLAGDALLRRRLGSAAQAQCQAFAYSNVGLQRAQILRQAWERWRGHNA